MHDTFFLYAFSFVSQSSHVPHLKTLPVRNQAECLITLPWSDLANFSCLPAVNTGLSAT